MFEHVHIHAHIRKTPAHLRGRCQHHWDDVSTIWMTSASQTTGNAYPEILILVWLECDGGLLLIQVGIREVMNLRFERSFCVILFCKCSDTLVLLYRVPVSLWSQSAIVSQRGQLEGGMRTELY